MPPIVTSFPLYPSSRCYQEFRSNCKSNPHLSDKYRSQLGDQFLDNHLLEGIKAWLEPLPDGSLPSLDIQKVLIKALTGLPIRTQHLRESGVV